MSSFSQKAILTKAAIYFSSLTLFSVSAWGANFVVTTNADNGSNSSPTAGSLRAAIVGSNAAGGTNTITFSLPANSTITLASSLPPITNPANYNLTITGSNGVMINGNGSFQAFYAINQPAVTTTLSISNLTVTNCKAKGGNGGTYVGDSTICNNGFSNPNCGGAGGGGGMGGGGALMVGTATGSATTAVTLQNVNFSSNSAQGGNGGVGGVSPFGVQAVVFGGGGGGGFCGGNGGNQGSNNNTGGGGGGGGDAQGITGSDNSNTNGGNGGNGGDVNANGANTGGSGTGGAGALGAGNGGGGGGAGGGSGVAGNPGVSPAATNGFNGGSNLNGTGGGGGGGGSRTTGVGNSMATPGGGAGGYGGGGGGAGSNIGTGHPAPPGGQGGFGAGGGGGGQGNGGGNGAGGLGGTNAGAGGSGTASGAGGGGGGAALGGGIHVQAGGQLTIIDSITLSGNSVTAGSGGVALGGGNNGTAGSTFGPDIYLSGGTLVFNITGSNSLTFSNIISADNAPGGGAVTKNGTGTLILSGSPNTYGETNINAGTLSISVPTNLGTGNNVNFAGGTLATTQSMSFNSGTFNFSGSGDFDVAPGTTLTLTGVVNLTGSGPLIKTDTGKLVISGIAHTYTAGTQFNGGIINVDNPNRLGTGGLSFNGGTLQVTTGETFSVAVTLNTPGGGTFDTASGSISLTGGVSGAGSLTVSPSGNSLRLSNTNTYSGATTINASTLLGLAANAFSPNSDVTLVGASTLDLNGFAQTIGSVGGPGQVNISANLTIGSATGTSATLSGNLNGAGGLIMAGQAAQVEAISSNNTGVFTGPVTFQSGILSVSNSNNLVSSSGFTFTGGTFQATSSVSYAQSILLNTAGTFDTTPSSTNMTLTGPITGAGTLTKTGPGTLTLTNAGNTYSVGTNFNGGTISISNAGNIGTGGTFTFNGGTLQATSSMSLSQTTTLNASGGTFDTTSGTTLTMTGAIGGTGSLTKIENGLLVLTNGGNNYSGGSIINAGTLALSGAGTLNSAGAVTLNGGIFDISGITAGSQTIGDLSGVAGTTVNLGSKTLIEGTTNSTSFAGMINGTGAFTKQGSGTLTLTGSNTYTGGTTISAGTLALSGAGTLNSAGAVTVNAGSFDISAITAGSQTIRDLSGAGGTVALGTKTLVEGTGNSTSYAGVINGSGAFTKQGAGTLTLTGANTYTGGTTINTGTVALSGAGSLASTGAVAINGGTFDISAIAGTSTTIGDLSGTSGMVALGAKTLVEGTSNSTTYAGTIIGVGGGFTKQGSGTLTLTNAGNTYSGGTNFNGGTISISSAGNIGTGPFTFNGGTLQATSSMSLPQTTTLNASGGTLDTTSGTTLTMTGAIGGTGSLTKIENGLLVLTNGGNNYSGGSIINAGTLALSGAGTLNAAGAVTINGGSFDISGITAGSQTIGDLSGAGGTSVALGSKTLVEGTGNSTSYAGVINGTGSFTKQGGGTLTLTGVNTYSGGTTVTLGTFALSGSGTISSSGAVTVNAGSFDISGINFGSQTIGDLSGLGGTVALGGNTLIEGTGNSTSYAGIINGSGAFIKQGAGTLTLTGANTYTGGTTINSGTLALSGAGSLASTGAVTINSGTFDISAAAGTITIGDLSGAAGTNVVLGANTLIEGTSNSTTYAGVISGVGGGFTKQGTGTLTLTGTNTYTGATTVANGKLLVNGVIQGVMTVNQPGILGGTGTINQLINNWHVEPGASIGTLNVSGNYVSNSGSFLLMEIAPNGTSDLLNVSGTVTINNGSTLEVTPENGTYTMGTIYTIVTGSSITGTFSNVIVDPFGPRNTRLQVSVIYDPTMILLQLTGISMTSFSQVAAGSGATPNERAVAAAIDAFGLQPTGDQGVIVAALDSLASNPAAFNAALNQLQPSPFTALALTQESDSVKVRSAFTHRLQELYTITCSEKYSEWERYNVWIEPFGDFIHQHSQGGQPGFHTKGGGVVIGSDFRLVKNWYFGLGAGYSHDSIDWRMTPKDEGEIDSYYGGVYTTWRPREYYFYIDASFVGAYNGYEATRHIEFATINRRARSTHQGYELAGQVGVGGLFQVGRLLIQPFGREEYIFVHEDDYTERGAQSIDLHIHRKNSDLWRTEVGLNLSGCFNRYPVKVIPTGYVSWVHEHRNKGKHITANFRDQAFNFTVTGFNPRHRDLVSGGIGLTTLVADDHCAIGLLYDFEVNEHYWDNELSLRVGYGF